MALNDLLNALEARATVVTVNDRLARRVREAYGERCRAAGQDAWETPSVLPFGGWLMSLYAARRDAAFSGAPPAVGVLLSPPQAEIVWARLIRQSRDGGELLQPVAAAEAAAEAWRLCQAWRIPLERLAAGNDDSLAFAGWARAWQRLCAQKGWLDSAMLPDWLRDELDHVTLPEQLVLAGFDEWTPQQTALLDAISARGVAVSHDESPVEQGTVTFYKAADAEAELQAAAQWAAAGLRADSRLRIGIVVPDLETRREAAIRAVTAAIDPAALAPAAREQARPVNVSLGAALASAPLVYDALLALRCGGATFDLADVGRLLRSPFVGGAEQERVRRAQLDVDLRDHGEIRVTGGTLNRYAERAECPLWRHHWQAFQNALAAAPRKGGARVWAEVIDAALSALGWPGDRGLDSSEKQTLDAFRNLLMDFARLDPVLDAPMDRAAALGLLRRMAAQRKFQPQQAGAPIQVLGVLEAAGLDFDRLWVTGLDDRRWPARPEPNPFIPLAVQREHGLPHATAERELAFAAAIGRRLFGAAPEVVASWPAREGDVVLRPSPLLEVGVRDSEFGVRDEGSLDWRGQIHLAARLESLVDDRAPPLAPGAAIHGGTGLLKDQASCPFKAFARRRLAAEAPALPAPGLDPAVRGQLMHAALEALWQTVVDQATLAGMDSASRAAVVGRAVDAALEREAARRPATLSPRLRELERARLADLLEQWLELELARSPFRVLARESDAELAVGGITLRFRIDRIDALDGGGQAVIDYKTGRIGGGVWEGERPDEPQLPAYALARGDDVSAVLFASLRRGELAYRGVALDWEGIRPLYKGAETADPAELRREWRDTLEALASAFRDGHVAVDPKNGNGTCAHCDLGPLCRIAERNDG
ncbi:MAG TPA: PD-(D/E)XK nuclease family protein [Gammaproteobacteria bacterium]|nr:PD-(D/E)XK nuclease family protein [Gammaproteobacteria bacterium]